MRERIAESALRQILKFGLRKFTIDDITTDLGISRKTLYKHFVSKNQLIEHVLDKYMTAELNQHNEIMASTSSFCERFEGLILPIEHKPVPTRLLAELQQYFPEFWARCEEAVQVTRNQIIQIYTEGIDNGEIRSEIHPAIIDIVVKKAIDAALDHRFLAENDLGLVQALHDIKNMVLHGILVQDKSEGEGE